MAICRVYQPNANSHIQSISNIHCTTQHFLLIYTIWVFSAPSEIPVSNISTSDIHQKRNKRNQPKTQNKSSGGTQIKIVTWNVNGLRACLQKGFADYARSCDADIFLLQETKLNAPLAELIPALGQANKSPYKAAYNFADRMGYSGTLALYRNKPISVRNGIGFTNLDTEGRVITLEYQDHFVVCAYVPNSQANLARQYYRMEWDKAFREYVLTLSDKLPVIIGGDFNAVHDHIDIYPENLRNDPNPSGFMEEERDGIAQLIECGFVDVYRHFNPIRENAYTWWSTRHNHRTQNKGWRIDYFFVSESILPKVESIKIRDDIHGSDHCPVEILLGFG